MNLYPASVRELTDVMDAQRTLVHQSMDTDYRNGKKAAAHAPFEEGQPFAYVPRKLVEEQMAKVHADLERQTAEFVFDLNESANKAEPRILAQLAIDRAALTPEQVGRMVTGNLNHERALDPQVGLTIEFILARVDREMRDATPREWLARYETALSRENDLESGLVVYATERALAEGRSWPGQAGPKHAGEEMQLAHLGDRIRKAKDERVPEATKKAQIALSNARTLYERLTQGVHRIQPVRRKKATA